MSKRQADLPLEEAPYKKQRQEEEEEEEEEEEQEEEQADEQEQQEENVEDVQEPNEEREGNEDNDGEEMNPAEKEALLTRLLRNPFQVASLKIQQKIAEETKQQIQPPPHFRSCFFPKIAPVAAGCVSSPLSSKYGGCKPYLKKDENWPICGDCSSPLSFYFQLALKDLPSALKGAHCIVTKKEIKEKGMKKAVEEADQNQLLQLFLCTSGNCENIEAFSSSSLVRIIDRRKQTMKDVAEIVAPESETLKIFTEKEITGFSSPFLDHCTGDDLPPSCVFDEHPDEDVEKLQQDKISGFAFWAQGPDYPDCPLCCKKQEEDGDKEEEEEHEEEETKGEEGEEAASNTLSYMYQLTPTNFDNTGFFGEESMNEVGILYQCLKHKEIVAFNWSA